MSQNSKKLCPICPQKKKVLSCHNELIRQAFLAFKDTRTDWTQILGFLELISLVEKVMGKLCLICPSVPNWEKHKP